MKHKLESRLAGEISISYADDTTLMAESKEKLKSFLMRVKEESEIASLKLNIKKKTKRLFMDWKKHKLESRLPGEISITLDMQMILPLWQKVKKN